MQQPPELIMWIETFHLNPSSKESSQNYKRQNEPTSSLGRFWANMSVDRPEPRNKVHSAISVAKLILITRKSRYFKRHPSSGHCRPIPEGSGYTRDRSSREAPAMCNCLCPSDYQVHSAGMGRKIQGSIRFAELNIAFNRGFQSNLSNLEV